MAGDWIPVRTDLKSQPEVLEISEKTGRSIHEVMGLLIDFWSWISIVSEDGKIPFAFCSHSVRKLLQAVGADENFWVMVEQVGWIKTKDGIQVPGFDIWLSSSGKRRLKERRRMKLAREKTVRNSFASCSQNVRTPAHEMRTTGQDISREHHPPPIPPPRGDVVCVDLTTKTTEDPPSKARPATPPDPEIERAWLQVPGRLKARRQARPIEDLGAYIATLRKSHRNPQDAFPWWNEEDPPPAAPSKERLCPGCQRPLERLSRRTGSDVCLDCERRGDARDARKEAPF